MTRILALDIGTVRIGVAVSDPTNSFAQGLCVLPVAGDWMGALEEYVAAYRAKTVLVGMPRRTDGTEGPEVGRMKKVVLAMAGRFPHLEIVPWDERFTTTIAQQALIEADVSRAGRKQRVDKVAAVLLLQNYLDFNRNERAPQELPAFEMPPSGKGRRPRKRGGAYE